LKIAWILLLRCKGMSYREIAKQVENGGTIKTIKSPTLPIFRFLVG
jgi:hypothetical protein